VRRETALKASARIGSSVSVQKSLAHGADKGQGAEWQPRDWKDLPIRDASQ
jgi:hypothetical protein